MDPSEELLPAERRLLEALRANEGCHLIDRESTPSAEEMADWNDSNREIRAAFLRPLLLRFHPEIKPGTLTLRGALITGPLDLSNATIDPNVSLDYCRIDAAMFGGATFTGDAEFSGATFTRDALFDRATFTGNAKFDRATFTGKAGFIRGIFTRDAWFNRATFTGKAWFNRATFTGDTWVSGATFAGDVMFGGATFTGDAKFTRATFTGAAWFSVAIFTGAAWFDEVIFAGDAGFDRAMFTRYVDFAGVPFAGDAGFRGATFAGDAGFDRATFAGDAAFRGAMFARDARFRGATFTGDADFYEVLFARNAEFRKVTFGGKTEFNGVCAHSLSFRTADFNGPDLGIAFVLVHDLILDGIIFKDRLQLTAMCSTISIRRSQLRSGGHLRIHAADLAADGAEFLGHTIIDDPGDSIVGQRIRRLLPGVARDARAAATRDLHRELRKLAGRKPAVSSLQKANVGNLMLSAVVLDRCQFAGAHGLDILRIDASCHLASSPTGWRWPHPLRFTRRHVIAEERHWRQRHTTWDGERNTGDPEPPTAPEIAGIYRDLRKGLEDIKNEPGAADFYYGEMELRRLGRREGSTATPRAERWLLHAYWAVSGYGLRAWRAFAAVTVLILVAAAVFATVGIAAPTGTTAKPDSVDLTTGTINYPPQEATVHGFGDALEMAVRSLALLRNPGTAPDLTTIGTITDVLLRLLTPVLLGFALLALRGRTKR